MGGRVARTTHGDYGYAQKHRCPCDSCRLAVRRYAKRLAYDYAQGVRRRVDADPVREHVLNVMAMTGVSESQIATAAGITRSQVARLLYGNPVKGGGVVEYLLNKTAAALLGVTAETALATSGFVSSVGTRRRIQALSARGYSKGEIGAACGVSDSAVFAWMSRDLITTGVADKVKDAYERLQMGEGSNEAMRWRARRLGWLPPLAWDEDTIDDPNAEPDLSAVKCAVESCPRSVTRKCLCEKHHRIVKEKGGYASANKFRDRVLRLSRNQQHERGALMEQLADLKQLGASPEEAALRLGRGKEYIEKIWPQVKVA